MVEKIFARLGDASYSIYLIQVLIISGTSKVITHFVPSTSIDMLIATTAPIAIISGYFLYIYVEQPLLTLSRRIHKYSHNVASSTGDVQP